MAVRSVVIAVFLGACSVGEVDTGTNGLTDGGGGGGGEASFMTTIQPLVTACLGCHSAGQPPNLSSFAALGPTYKVKPGASNVLVTKGDASGGLHQGAAYFSPTDQATVAAWIDSL